MSTDDMNTPTTTDDDAVPLLDRNLYRTIKKMDRTTLEGLLNDLFERGRKKGLAEAGVIVAESEDVGDDDKTVDLRAVEADIKQIRGIGEKRAEEIMRIACPLCGCDLDPVECYPTQVILQHRQHRPEAWQADTLLHECKCGEVRGADR